MDSLRINQPTTRRVWQQRDRRAIAPRYRDMTDKPKESDWKLFRKIVPGLRERYLKEKNRDLLMILTDPEKTPTEQFWNTEEKIRKEGKVLVECLDGHRRSRMFEYMALMYSYGMLKEEDLKDFSDELQERLKQFLKI